MPYYGDLNTLPESVKNSLPLHARIIYMDAFNRAWEEYSDAEKRSLDSSWEAAAHRVAWSAVRKVYEKDAQSGEWKRKLSDMRVRV